MHSNRHGSPLESAAVSWPESIDVLHEKTDHEIRYICLVVFPFCQLFFIQFFYKCLTTSFPRGLSSFDEHFRTAVCIPVDKCKMVCFSPKVPVPFTGRDLFGRKDRGMMRNKNRLITAFVIITASDTFFYDRPSKDGTAGSFGMFSLVPPALACALAVFCPLLKKV